MKYWLSGASAQGDRFLYCQELLVCLLVAESYPNNTISLEQSLFSEIYELKEISVRKCMVHYLGSVNKRCDS